MAGAIAIEQQHIAVFAQQHSVISETHDSTESGVRNEVSVFPVYGNKPLGLHDREVRLDVISLSVTGCMNIGDTGVNDLRSPAQQPIDDSVHIVLITRNCVTRQHNSVAVTKLHETILASSEQRKG